MDIKIAKQISDLLLRQCAEQNQILKVVQASEPDLEFRRIRSMIGQTMGSIYGEALRPIFLEHPELEPPALRDKGTQSAG